MTKQRDQIAYARTDDGDIAVYLGMRRVGTITGFAGGWAYVPDGLSRQNHGEILPTIDQVKSTLEAEVV